MTESHADSAPAAGSSGGPGATLKSAREQMGVSAREVADALNLSISVVEGIEANDPARLPPTAFARGYIRSYAKLFELDADVLVGQFEALVGETPTSEVVAMVEPPDSALHSLLRRQPSLLWGGALAVLVLLVLLGVWLFSGSDDEVSPAADAVTESPEQPGRGDTSDSATGGEPPELTNTPTFESAPTVVDVSEPVVEPIESEQRLVEARDSEAIESAVETAASSVVERRLTPDGDDTLAFRFSEDSWLVVSDGSGTRLYSNLGKAGSQLRFVGQAPFRLVVGYAPGVRLTFNGDDVRLAPHTRNNKATLFLRP